MKIIEDDYRVADSVTGFRNRMWGLLNRVIEQYNATEDVIANSKTDSIRIFYEGRQQALKEILDYLEIYKKER